VRCASIVPLMPSRLLIILLQRELLEVHHSLSRWSIMSWLSVNFVCSMIILGILMLLSKSSPNVVSLYFVAGRSSLSIGISTNSYSLLCCFNVAITL